MSIPAAKRTSLSDARPAAGRVFVALVAIVTLIAVGVMSLFATPASASASTLLRAGNGVGVIAHADGQRVGLHEDIPAGQGRARAPNYDKTAVGSGVGAETEVPQILANQAAGNAARDAIAARYPGADIEQTFQTALGARRVDVLTQDGLAIESKVGYTSLTQSIQTQIAKDQLLMQNPAISGVQWEFSPSAVTGQVGPSGPLAAALDKAGIPWSIGP